MRKTFFLPIHIKDRLRKYRDRNGDIEEQVAIIRLLDLGLTAAENGLRGSHLEDIKNTLNAQLENAVFKI